MGSHAMHGMHARNPSPAILRASSTRDVYSLVGQEGSTQDIPQRMAFITSCLSIAYALHNTKPIGSNVVCSNLCRVHVPFVCLAVAV